MHVNFSILLDGTTSMTQVLEYWDAEWDLRTLVQYVKDLMIDPNLRYLLVAVGAFTKQQKHHRLPSAFIPLLSTLGRVCGLES